MSDPLRWARERSRLLAEEWAAAMRSMAEQLEAGRGTAGGDPRPGAKATGPAAGVDTRAADGAVAPRVDGGR